MARTSPLEKPSFPNAVGSFTSLGIGFSKGAVKRLLGQTGRRSRVENSTVLEIPP